VNMCVFVCMCERERDREINRKTEKQRGIDHNALVCLQAIVLL
jgi:hypothetical protein